MVAIKNEKAQPLIWQMGRIIDIITGIDGIVRINSGITKRAVTKLAVLSIDTSSLQQILILQRGEDICSNIKRQPNQLLCIY